MSIIRAICFDFDGTLAQFSGDFTALQTRFGLELGLTEAEVRRLEQHRIQLERQDGRVTFYSTVRAAFNEAGLTAPDGLEQIAEDTVAHYCSQMKLLPGASEVLTFCQSRNLPLALLTNGTSDMQRKAVQAVEIESCFKRILVSGDADVAVRKPNPRIFKMACEALGTKPGETLMVGDNLGADIQGALSYGMQAVYLGSETGMEYETLPSISETFSRMTRRLGFRL